MLSVVEAANATKRSPIFLYALHLVELTGRFSAMLIVPNTRRSGRPAVSHTQAQSDHTVAALEFFEQFSPEVSVQPLTAISPYATMHEGICAHAKDKHVALILIHFHKELTVDGSMEATNPIYLLVNQNVLSTAPCSVAILIDRGLSAPAVSCHHSHLPTSRRIVVLFFGGVDDREAFCLAASAARMAECPGYYFTLVRCLPGSAISATSPSPSPADATDHRLDDVLINEFRHRLLGDESVLYMERVVDNG